MYLLTYLLTYLLIQVGCCCCRHASGIKHFNVEHTSSTFYLKDIHFSALDQLVDYYSRTDVPNKEQIGGVRLRFPVNRPQICPSVYEDLTSLSSANDGAVYLHPVSVIRCVNCPETVGVKPSAIQPTT